MTAQTLSMNAPAARKPRRLAPVRAVAAEGIGWAAYGLFYVTVLATLVGLPVGFALYLVGLQN